MTRLRPTRRVALALTLALGCETRLLLVESPSDSDAVADVGGATGDGAAQDGDSFGGAAGSGSGIPPRCVATCAANEACVDDDCVVVQRDPELAAGISATCVRRGSALHCWGGGNGRSVVLGTGDGIEHLTPVRVGSQILWSEVSTSAGELFCGRSVDGQGRCWGGNSSGQLGVGDGEERAIPTLIDDFRFTRVRGGSGHSCGLDAERRAYCWGRNLDGDLGIGTTDSAATPRRVQLEAVLADLAVGWGHSCAVDVSGKLYCWGRNLEGQLGVGSTTNSSRPFQVGSRDDYIRVQLGGRHSGSICAPAAAVHTQARAGSPLASA